MAITEETRHHLYQALERTLGPEEAATLMEHLPPVGWADVATKADLDHASTVTGMRFDAVHRRFDEVDRRFEEVDRRFEEVDRRFEEVDRRFEAVDRRFDEVDQRFDKVDHRFDLVDGRLDRLETGMIDVRTSIEALHHSQATFLRQLTLALFVALVSILVAAVGLS